MTRKITRGCNTLALIAALSSGLVMMASPRSALAQYRPLSLPDAAVPNGIGVSDHNLAETPQILKIMHDAGIRYIRTDLSWQSVEQTPGRYYFDGTHGSPDYVTFVNNATAAGIKVMFILDYSNTLYDTIPGTHMAYSPESSTDADRFGAFVLAALARFSGRGIIWEIYNEPTGFWKDPGCAAPDYTGCLPYAYAPGTHPGTPRLTGDSKQATVLNYYSRLANHVGQLIKQNYPEEFLIGPAMANMNSRDPRWQASLDFLQQTYREGGSNYLDAVSVHPYRWNYPEWVSEDYGKIRSALVGNSADRPAIISSEWGYTSCYYSSEAECKKSGDGGPLNQSDAEILKGKFVVRSLLMNMASDIRISILYDWMDDGTDPGNPENNYGIVRNYPLGTAAPVPLFAFKELKTMTSELMGYSFTPQNSTLNGTDYILHFINATDSRYACWAAVGPVDEANTRTGQTVTIPMAKAPHATVRVTFEDPVAGTVTRTIQADENGNVACTETDNPQYFSAAQ